MDPKEIELRQKIKDKLAEARNLIDAGKLEEAEAAKKAAEELRKQLDMYIELRNLEDGMPSPQQPAAPAVIITNDDDLGVGETREDKKNNKEHRDAFIAMLRGRGLTSQQRSILEEKRAMNSTSGEDGGYLIPPDIQVMINEIKRQYLSLEDLVTEVPVTTNSGSRVLEKYVDITPFAQIATENTDLADLDNPKVKQVSYSIKDYGGILTLTNNLLADSPENIMSFISKWIARKEIITDNSLILAVLSNVASKPAIADLDDLKLVLNVTLDPMIASGATIVTNQDGYQFLDTLKDGMGRYLLQPDPTQAGRYTFMNKPVVVMANRLLPTVSGKAPIIIGDLKESVVVFDRQETSILSTNIGGGAFEKNTTKVRVIDREDVKAWDDGAWVYGEITIS